MQLSGALLLAGFATTGLAASIAAAAKPTVYLIRHGEKPADDDEVGLSAQGEQRAQCLRTVFGAASKYNIGYILAQTPKDGELYGIVLTRKESQCADQSFLLNLRRKEGAAVPDGKAIGRRPRAHRGHVVRPG